MHMKNSNSRTRASSNEHDRHSLQDAQPRGARKQRAAIARLLFPDGLPWAAPAEEKLPRGATGLRLLLALLSPIRDLRRGGLHVLTRNQSLKRWKHAHTTMPDDGAAHNETLGCVLLRAVCWCCERVIHQQHKGAPGVMAANSRLVSTSSVVLRPVRRDDAGVPTKLDDKVEGAPL